MAIMIVRGFYPEPNPDNLLQYEIKAPLELISAILSVMEWPSMEDGPLEEVDLTDDQLLKIMGLLRAPIRGDLIYCLGIYSG